MWNNKKKLKGFTLLETSMAVIISIGVLFVSLTMLSRVPNTTEDTVGQGSVVAVDAALNDIKKDYFRAVEYTVAGDTITFVTEDYVNTYSYDKPSGKLSKNGLVMVVCDGFDIEVNRSSLFVSIKTEGGKLMDLSVYK